MTELQTINGKEVWIKVDPHPVERANANIIPTEFFTASYSLTNPEGPDGISILLKDDQGEVKLFESPVAALTYATKKLPSII